MKVVVLSNWSAVVFLVKLILVAVSINGSVIREEKLSGGGHPICLLLSILHDGTSQLKEGLIATARIAYRTFFGIASGGAIHSSEPIPLALWKRRNPACLARRWLSISEPNAAKTTGQPCPEARVRAQHALPRPAWQGSLGSSLTLSPPRHDDRSRCRLCQNLVALFPLTALGMIGNGTHTRVPAVPCRGT